LLVNAFGWTFGAVPREATTVLRVLVASLTALAIFRSSLFTVRIGDADVGVGPSTLLTTLLGIADRGVDRRRATDRSRQVTKIMSGVSFGRARLALPAFCLALLQNVPPSEQHDLGIAVEALSASSMSDTQKAYALGLLLMNLAGPDVLSDAVSALRAELADSAGPAGRPAPRTRRPAVSPLHPCMVSNALVISAGHPDAYPLAGCCRIRLHVVRMGGCVDAPVSSRRSSHDVVLGVCRHSVSAGSHRRRGAVVSAVRAVLPRPAAATC
jgi:hypothetical protein